MLDVRRARAVRNELNRARSDASGVADRVGAVVGVAVAVTIRAGLLVGLVGCLLSLPLDAGRVGGLLTDPRGLRLGLGQIVLPPVLHGLDQSAADADHDHTADRGQDHDQDRSRHGGGHAHLVQRGDNTEEQDEDRGGIGQGRAVGEPAQGAFDEHLDCCGDRGGDNDDDDGHDQAREERDDLGQQRADGVGSEDAEGQLQDEEQQRVVDELADEVAGVEFGVLQRLLDPATLHGVVEADLGQERAEGFADGLGHDDPDDQDQQEDDQLGDEVRHRRHPGGKSVFHELCLS